MAETVERDGSSPEDVALKLLYVVSWSENIDLEGWEKTNRAWILDTFAECLLAVRDPESRMAQAARRAPAPPSS